MKDPALSARKMSAIYGETASPAMAERFIAVNEVSIRSIFHDCGCVFAYGEKDSNLKECRKVLPAAYPGAKLEVWPGYAHCGRMTADSENYAAMLKGYLE